jgi:uncharacterized protein YidB (DUF937 family)
MLATSFCRSLCALAAQAGEGSSIPSWVEAEIPAEQVPSAQIMSASGRSASQRSRPAGVLCVQWRDG